MSTWLILLTDVKRVLAFLNDTPYTLYNIGDMITIMLFQYYKNFFDIDYHGTWYHLYVSAENKICSDILKMVRHY